jgi:hypothetical protein
MIHDPIVEEVHRIREKLLAEFGGDLHALCEAMRRETEEARQAGKAVRPSTSRPPRVIPVVSPNAKKMVG